MYKCNNCGHVFYEPIEEDTSYEEYYGIAGDFPYNTPLTLYFCPHCESEDYEEYYEDEEYEEDEEGDEL